MMLHKSTKQLRKFVAPEIIVGIDARLLVGRYIEHFESQKPFIVTDKKVELLPWFADIMEAVKSSVKDYVIFSDVTPNPKDSEAMQGAKRFLQNRCDLVIAIGGGSPMDCAKCISVVSTNGGNIAQYEGVDSVDQPGPPLICIPCTAGTAADVSQFAIFLDTGESTKKAVISKKVVPDLALIDPIPLLTMDRQLTACTGMDALTHAIEAFVSNAQSCLTDVHALEGIRLLAGNLETATNKPMTIDTIFPVMIGSLQAGLAFSNASLGAVHALAHSLGGIFDLPHGECNSILLAPVIEMNFAYASERYTEIAQVMGMRTQHASPEQIKAWLIHRISTMREALGIKPFYTIPNFSEYREQMIDNALDDPCIVTNPRALGREEVREIYERIIKTQ